MKYIKIFRWLLILKHNCSSSDHKFNTIKFFYLDHWILRLVSNTDHLSVLVLPYHLTLKRSVIVRSIIPYPYFVAGNKANYKTPFR